MDIIMNVIISGVIPFVEEMLRRGSKVQQIFDISMRFIYLYKSGPTKKREIYFTWSLWLLIFFLFDLVFLITVFFYPLKVLFRFFPRRKTLRIEVRIRINFSKQKRPLKYKGNLYDLVFPITTVLFRIEIIIRIWIRIIIRIN